jgi:hypothetical protein
MKKLDFAVLARMDKEGGGVVTLTKLRGRFNLRNHVIADGRPLCGGGNGGKHAHWQMDINTPTCERYLTIQKRRQTAKQEVVCL